MKQSINLSMAVFCQASSSICCIAPEYPQDIYCYKATSNVIDIVLEEFVLKYNDKHASDHVDKLLYILYFFMF